MHQSKILLAALFLTCGQALAAPADCSALPASSLTAKLLESPIETNFRHGYRTLKGMSEKYAQDPLEVLGLTVSKVVTRLSAKSSVLPDRTGHWECSTHQIQIEFGYRPITIHVAREFPQDTCGFKEIYAHEERHAKIYQEHARRVGQEIIDSLGKRFDHAEPLRGVAGSTQSRIQEELRDRWLPYIQRMLEKAKAEQREIDSPEEYERVMSSCGGEIRKYLKSH